MFILKENNYMKQRVCLVIITFLLLFTTGCQSFTQAEEGETADSASETVEEKTVNTDEVNLSVLFEYPSTYTSFMSSLNIKITRYPVSATYCRISASEGSVSDDTLYLNSNSQPEFSYSLPNTTVSTIHIFVTFYNENNRVIEESDIILIYSEENDYYEVGTVRPVVLP